MSRQIDTNPPSLETMRICIAGLGLIGGSLALALKDKVGWLAGFDPDARVRDLANQWQLANLITGDLAKAVHESNMIILAAPIRGILELIQQVEHLVNTPAIVLDVGSTKKDIVQAMQVLPERFDPIGGHPMCGKEIPSLQNADPQLFKNAVFALTPLERTSDRAKSAVSQLVNLIGAQPVLLDAAEHDFWVAHTSHFPYLLAHGLASITPQEAAGLVGPGFRSTTRLAGAFQPMMLDVLAANKKNVQEVIQKFRCFIDNIEILLAEEDQDELRAFLETASRNRQELLENQEKACHV